LDHAPRPSRITFDLLVEAFDAFAVPAPLIHGDASRIVRENHICVAPKARHSSCALDRLAKILVEEKSYEEIGFNKADGYGSGHLGAVRRGHGSKGR